MLLPSACVGPTSGNKNITHVSLVSACVSRTKHDPMADKCGRWEWPQKFLLDSINSQIAVLCLSDAENHTPVFIPRSIFSLDMNLF